MRVAFLLDAPAFENPEVRFALRTLALLVGLPGRFASAGSGVGEEEIPVHVGARPGAPADAAAVIPAGAWPAWDPGTLRAATFEGFPLLCPQGDFRPLAAEAELPEPWLRSVAHVLTREEEEREPHRDEWQCFAGFFSRQHELGLLGEPLVNHAADQLARRLARWCDRHGRRAQPLPRWRDGARFAVLLSHDVDDITCYSWAEVVRLLGRARSPRSYALRRSLAQMARLLGRGGAAGDPYWQFEKWIAEEDRHSFRSTFYVFPTHPSPAHEYDPTYRLTDAIGFEGRTQPYHRVLATLAERGWEVGMHGGYHSYRNAAELERERAQIEGALGRPIHGTRQHYLRFDAGSTWHAQETAGFAYDTTLGYNEALGFRAGIAAPFRPWDPARREIRRIVELPLTVMDGVLFRTLKLDARLAARRVREHLEAVERVGGLAVLLWHPNGVDARQFPGWWDSYREVLGYLATRPVWVATGAELAAWWAEREIRLLGPNLL